MSECKFEHTNRGGLYIMVFMIFFWVVFIKGCESNSLILDKLEIIEAKLENN